MYLRCTRSRAAILALVQFHITEPSPHSVTLCLSVSVVPQHEQVIMVTRWIAAHRSFFGIMSCVAVYHVDFIVSGSPAVCTFAHTRGHGSSRYLRMIRISLVSLPIFTIVNFERFHCFTWAGWGHLCHIKVILTDVGYRC